MSAQGEPASGAWPAAVCAVSWALFGLAVLVAYSPGGPLDRAVGPILALPPAALAALGAVRSRARTPAGTSLSGLATNVASVVRLSLAAGVALLLVPLSATILGGSAPSPGLDGLSVRRWLPGPGEGWTYLAAAGLTVAAAVPGRRWPVIGAMTVLAAAALSGAVVMAWNGAFVERGSDPGAAGCTQPLGIAVAGPIESAATGDLDGAPLGSVVAVGRDGGPLAIRYDTRWGAGTAEAAGDDPATLGPLLDAALGSAERVTADDLGIDLLNGTAARHCQLVIDGRSAVAGFVALRWLTGADARTTDAGAGLEAWRGTLDYWVVQGRLVLAAVSIDGQPPRWPFPGLRAVLRATIWFGES